MQKIIILVSFLISIKSVSQVTVFQSIGIFKNNKDSCSILTKLNNGNDKVFSSEVRCKTIDSDSIKLIELKKTKLIRENLNWRNKKSD